MSDLKEVYELEIARNAEGIKLAYMSLKGGETGYRIAGPKAWGGSKKLEEIEIRQSDLVEFILSYAPQALAEILRRTQPEATAPAHPVAEHGERAAFDLAYLGLCQKNDNTLRMEDVKQYADAHWNGEAGAMWQARAALESSANALDTPTQTDIKQAREEGRITFSGVLPRKHTFGPSKLPSPANALSAGDRVDAERYRWLRDVGDETWKPMGQRVHAGGIGIDAAIDAAILQSQKGENQNG